MKIRVLALCLLILASCGKNSSSKDASESEVQGKSTANEVAVKTVSKKEPKPVVQEPVTLPVGTILFIKTTKDIYAKSFKAGDHFFVELDKDITQKGKVIIPKGTTVQMEVLKSENKKRRSSQFAVTVGGFIVDNYLRKVQTETKEVKTKDMAGGTLKRAAIGAGVGAVFDGGKGAGKGAAVGGALGLLKPGQSIHFPAGTQATFQLEKPLIVNW